MARVETRLENQSEREEKRDLNRTELDREHSPLIQYEGQNARDPDDQRLKSIKLNVSTFDDRLDPQVFLK